MSTCEAGEARDYNIEVIKDGATIAAIARAWGAGAGGVEFRVLFEIAGLLEP